MSEWIDEVEALVGDRREVVTFTWLSQHLEISPDFAKKILYETFAKHIGNCDALFCVTGVTKSENQHLIQLVRHEQLKNALKKLKTASSVYLYCLGPKDSVSAVNVVNASQTDVEQYFRKLKLGPSTSKPQTTEGQARIVERTRRPSLEGSGRKVASKGIDDSDMMTSPSKRHIKEETKELCRASAAKRRTSAESPGAKKKPKVQRTGDQTACVKSGGGEESARASIRNLSKAKKQTSLTSFFSKR